jgi:hypothetical protein
VTPLLLADSLQRFLDRGHGVRRVDEREGPQCGPSVTKPVKDVGAPLALALVLDGRDQTGRHPRAVFRVLQEHEVLRFAQLDLDGQGIGFRHRAADDTTRLGERQPGGLRERERIMESVTWTGDEVTLVLAAAKHCDLIAAKNWADPLAEATAAHIAEHWLALVEALIAEPDSADARRDLLAHARTALAFTW